MDDKNIKTRSDMLVEEAFGKHSVLMYRDAAVAVLFPAVMEDGSHTIGIVLAEPDEETWAGDDDFMLLADFKKKEIQGRLSGHYATEEEAWAAAALFLDDLAKAVREKRKV